MCVWVAEGPRLRSAQENPKSGIAGSDHGSGAFGAGVLAELFPHSWPFFCCFSCSCPRGECCGSHVLSCPFSAPRCPAVLLGCARCRRWARSRPRCPTWPRPSPASSGGSRRFLGKQF